MCIRDRAIAVQGDVAKKSDIQRLFAETKKAYGRLDVLVNSAGIYEFLPLELITEEPVSYTHLDVYKRQGYLSGGCFDGYRFSFQMPRLVFVSNQIRLSRLQHGVQYYR